MQKDSGDEQDMTHDECNMYRHDCVSLGGAAIIWCPTNKYNAGKHDVSYKMPQRGTNTTTTACFYLYSLARNLTHSETAVVI